MCLLCCEVKSQTCFNVPQYERSKAAYDVLTSSTDAKGRRIEVVKMPGPPPLFITQVNELLSGHFAHVNLLGHLRSDLCESYKFATLESTRLVGYESGGMCLLHRRRVRAS